LTATKKKNSYLPKVKNVGVARGRWGGNVFLVFFFNCPLMERFFAGAEDVTKDIIIQVETSNDSSEA